MNAIEIRGVEKTFPKFKLGPLDLTVPPGAIYGLIGPNGAGKTTALELIFGLGRVEAGTIRVMGLDHEQDEVAMKLRSGLVSPDLNYQSWGTVGKAVQFVRGFYPAWDDAYSQRLLAAFHLGWGEKIVELSYGARIKLSLLLSLSWRPQVLVLDEPTVGLDALSRQQVFGELLAAVQEEERSVLISSHNLSDLERLADHIGIINRGKMLMEGQTSLLLEAFRMVDFTLGNGFSSNRWAGLYVQRQEGNRCRALLDTRQHSLESLESHGARQLSSAPVSLEDLFLALVKSPPLERKPETREISAAATCNRT